MDTDQLLDKLTNAVTFKYKDDKTAPGVTVSKLKKGYYCSVVRYNQAFAKGKQVVCTSRGEKLSDTLLTLAQTFVSLNAAPKDPLQSLSDDLGK